MTGARVAGLLGAALALLAAIGPARGQPPPARSLFALEEEQVAGQGRLFRYDWSGSSYARTLLWQPPGYGTGVMLTQGVILDLDNETLIVAHFYGDWSLTGVAPTGQVLWSSSTPVPASGRMGLPCLDQSGDLCVPAEQGQARFVFRFDQRTRRTISTIATFASHGSSDWITQDLDAGEYLLPISVLAPPASILRVGRTGAISTVAGLELVGQAHYYAPLDCNYVAGGYVVRSGMCCVFSIGLKWIFLAPYYRESLLDPLGTMAGKRGGQVLHESRWSYGVEAGVTAVAEVVQRQAVGGGEWRYPIAPQSAVFRGVSGPPIVGGSRKLAGRGSALPGSEYEFLLCFPGEAGASYLTGASLALRPGIQLSNGKYVPLAPDGLLTWSLSDPGTFAGFVGTLDGASRARAVWRIPGVPGLRGVRVYFAALTLGPAGVATVSDPIGVSIQ